MLGIFISPGDLFRVLTCKISSGLFPLLMKAALEKIPFEDLLLTFRKTFQTVVSVVKIVQLRSAEGEHGAAFEYLDFYA